MLTLIFFVLLVAVTVAGAELVRNTCRRQLGAPAVLRSALQTVELDRR